MWQKNSNMWCWNCKTITCDVGTAQYEDETIKCEKNKWTTKCDKRIVTYDLKTAQCEDGTIKCEKINKETIKCEKRIVTYDVGTAQCENGTVKCEKKERELPNVRKEQSHVMLEMHNVRMKLSSVRKK